MAIGTKKLKNQSIRLSNMINLKTIISSIFIAFSISLNNPVIGAESEVAVHAKPEWISTRYNLLPGEKFFLGVHFKIDTDWHIYWRNGGEIGLPVQIEDLKAEGAVLKEIEWPTPLVHRDKTKLVSYIYSNETLLRIPGRVSAKLKPGEKVKISANIKWLECEDVCIPAEIKKEIQLNIIGDKKKNKADTDNPDLLIFKKFADKFPVSYPLQQKSHPIKIKKFGWDKKPISSRRNQKDQKINFTVEALVPEKKGKTIDKNWQRCRILPYENDKGETLSKNGSFPERQWEFGIGKIESRGVTARGRIIRFSVSAIVPEQYHTKPYIELICPHLDSKGLTLALPLSGYTIVKAVQNDNSDYSPLEEKALSGETDKALIFSMNFLWMIMAAFIGGLILNVMPCVLPVISIKVFSLTKQAGSDRKKLFQMGIMFALGIVSSFLLLSFVVIIVKSLGKVVGWGFQFQSPSFLVVLAIILLAFSLSLFNVYTFNVPRTGKIETVSRQGELAGSFFQGVLATILATPCSAPFLGSAMGFAFTQGSLVVIFIFFFAGLGMAFPYIILAWKPAGLKYLPKPGSWMESFKQFLGFLLLGTLIWIIWILGRMTGADGIINLIILLLILSLSLWVGGTFAPLGSSRKKFWSGWAFAFLIFMMGSFYYIPDIISSKPDKNQLTKAKAADGVQWKSFSVQSLRIARDSGKPVFLKFTADWCLTCIVNEKTVLKSDTVIESFKKWDVIAISADWTNGNKDVTNLLKSFGRGGVPFYVIYPPGKQSKPIPLSELITPGMIRKALDKIFTQKI